MMSEESFTNYTARLRAFITSARAEWASGEEDFNALALSLFQLQFEHNRPYRALCELRGKTPAQIQHWREIPAAPTSAFKEMELTSLGSEDRTSVFFSSGTTEQRRSRHFHSAASLSVYEASLLPAFERHLLADLNTLEELLSPQDKLPLLCLTPSPVLAPHSSLAHMFETVRREFGARDSLFAGRVDAGGAWVLDTNTAVFAIRKSMCANRPLMLLGTAFNFVHLLDHFAANNMRYHLARGSRVLETGGYKGQSREIAKPDLHALITKHLGIPAESIVTEYGMSELSSQAYDQIVMTSGPEFSRDSDPPTSGHGKSAAAESERIFHFPPWCRAQVISPETDGEVSEGETGLIRIFDLANVRSVMAIQTEDLGVRRGDGFQLIGRASQAEQRGCSLMSFNSNG